MMLPVMDAQALASGDGINALREACAGTGFFYVANHGLSDALIEGATAQMRGFFSQPVEQRMALSLTRSRCNRGYEAMQTQRLEPGTPPDLKEGFYIGNELPEDDPRVLAGVFNHGPNQWPGHLPEFRPAMVVWVFRFCRGQLLRFCHGTANAQHFQQRNLHRIEFANGKPTSRVRQSVQPGRSLKLGHNCRRVAGAS